MTKKLDYLIIAEKALIIEFYRGKYYVDELIDFKKKVGNDKEYNPCYNIIQDFREVEFLFKINEVSKYVEFISNNEKYLARRKSTMITETPNQVVTSIGFEILKKELPIQVKVCSTVEVAFAFVKLPGCDWEIVESLIDNLKNATEQLFIE
ncbi:MAG: hypothetical protein GQ564_15525 [Bacteroidales bacterium]|nr:hypothetical protein [Bacteroidales bacterium]